MPTYQYACTECGHQLEAVQSFSDPALTDCPVCEGRLRKLFSSVGIVFKGSGFYRTDSRNGNGNGSAVAKDGKSGKDSKDSKDSSKDSSSSSASSSASTSSGSGSSDSGSGGAAAAKATAAA